MYSIRRLAIIGGSLASLPRGFVTHASRVHPTPWGNPSAAVHIGVLNGLPALYLARHGEPHSIAPHRINYRANLSALADLGATHVVALNTVGGIADAALMASLWIPAQLIDYTWGRESSFYDGVLLQLEHCEFTSPFSAGLRELLGRAAASAGVQVRPEGVYGCTQGPRLETAAEVRRLRRDGCDLVGMTAMPETVLARELGLDYAMLAMVVNRAAGLSAQPLTIERMHEQAAVCMDRAMRVLEQLALLAVSGLGEGHG